MGKKMKPIVIDNFISSESASELNSYLKSISVLSPKNLLNVYITENGISDKADVKFNDLVIKIVKEIKDKFEVENLVLDRAMYQILETGQELGWHTDAYGGVDGYTESYYSALLYLTDDYGGGEILFYDDLSGDKEKSTSYKPDAGSLIYFKGDEETPHSVNMITSGERSNIILFYKIAK